MATNVEPTTDNARYLAADTHGETLLRDLIAPQLDVRARAIREAAARSDIGEAVHEVRKNLRRTRATIDLLRDALPNALWRESVEALRSARRSLGSARDRAVLPDVFTKLAETESVSAAADAMRDIVTKAAPATNELRQILGEVATAASHAIDLVRGALQELDRKTLLDGVARHYRAARRARKEGKRDRREFHAWRRRSKELGYQLDVLRNTPGLDVDAQAHEIDEMTDRLGPIVDLIMARDFVRANRDTLEREASRALLDALDALIDPAMVELRRSARKLFRRKPRSFAKRLLAAQPAAPQV